MLSSSNPIALGSASPRRRDILTDLGLPFFVCPANIDETPLSGELARPYLKRIVSNKLTAVCQLLKEQGDAQVESQLQPPRHFEAVLVADTTVVLGEKIVGKPDDEAQAYETLRELCGREHVVLTRYALARGGSMGSVTEAGMASPLFRTVESKVFLRSASDVELLRYAHTGEGLDKAGAYAVQGIGSFLVERIEGSYSNVVGLPACEVVLDLQSLGLMPDFPHKSASGVAGR